MDSSNVDENLKVEDNSQEINGKIDAESNHNTNPDSEMVIMQEEPKSDATSIETQSGATSTEETPSESTAVSPTESQTSKTLNKEGSTSSLIIPEVNENGDKRKGSIPEILSTPEPKPGQVKETQFGTPILNIASPYLKLPTDDKFAKDICDVINFENLPNSTGKYKKISVLLKKVKSEVDRIQES